MASSMLLRSKSSVTSARSEEKAKERTLGITFLEAVQEHQHEARVVGHGAGYVADGRTPGAGLIFTDFHLRSKMAPS